VLPVVNLSQRVVVRILINPFTGRAGPFRREGPSSVQHIPFNGETMYTIPDASRRSLLQSVVLGARLTWPVDEKFGRRSTFLGFKDLSRKPLPQLICEQWEFDSNLEFNTLILQPSSALQSLARRWVQKFQILGHTHDMLAMFPKQPVQLYRPVCVDSGKAYLCLHYLHHPAD